MEPLSSLNPGLELIGITCTYLLTSLFQTNVTSLYWAADSNEGHPVCPAVWQYHHAAPCSSRRCSWVWLLTDGVCVHRHRLWRPCCQLCGEWADRFVWGSKGFICAGKFQGSSYQRCFYCLHRGSFIRCVSPASHSVLPPMAAGAESRPLRPCWGPADENGWYFTAFFLFLWNNQTRGSMPFYWSQRPNLRYKPKPIISKTTNHVSWSFCTSTCSFQSREMEILC